MKKAILFLMGIFFFGSCNGQNVESGTYNAMLKTLLSHSVDEIGVDSLVKIRPQVQLLDAREFKEFEVSHIEGATHIGYDNFDSSLVHTLPRDVPVVVYCSVGYRSEKISEKLQNMGFTDVSNLYGGIFEWVNQGHAVVNNEGQTDCIHGYSRTWGIWLKRGKKVYK